MMPARGVGARATTVVIVGEPSLARRAVPASFADHGLRVFTCELGDLSSFVRAVQISALIVIGDRSGHFLAQLREAIAGARVSARRITIVSTVEEARSAVLRVADLPD